MAKIMMIHHAPNLGGGSISFVDIIKMLETEHTVIPCIPKNGNGLENLLIANNSFPIKLDIPMPTFNYYSGGHSLKTRTFWKGITNYRFHKEWVKFFKRYSPDIVIVNSSVLALLGPAIKEAGAKSICFVRETFVENRIELGTSIMKSMLNNFFDGVIFISNYDLKYANLTKPLVEVVADVIRPDSLRKEKRNDSCEKLNIEFDNFNVLFVGGTSYIKGLDLALEAMKYINNQKVKLIIAGKSDLDNLIKNKTSLKTSVIRLITDYKTVKFGRKIKNLIKDPVIKNKVTIVGLQTNMSYCYSASDLVIFPSNLPHQARPLFETGFYQKPIIISDYKQTNEYINNNQNGLTFKKKNAKDLALNIEKVLHNPETSKSLGLSNEMMTKNKHNFFSERTKLLSLIDSILMK